MDLTLAELQEMASRQQQQIETQQQMLATKVVSSQTPSPTAVNVSVETESLLCLLRPLSLT